jgi:hypothetical protein
MSSLMAVKSFITLATGGNLFSLFSKTQNKLERLVILANPLQTNKGPWAM